MTITEQIAKSCNKVAQLEFELRVEQTVLARLREIESPAEQRNSGGGNGADRMVPGSLPSQIKEVMDRLGRAVNNQELLAELQQKGISTNAKGGLKSTVAAVLSKRKDLFIRVGTGLYDLKSRHLGDTETENP